MKRSPELLHAQDEAKRAVLLRQQIDAAFTAPDPLDFDYWIPRYSDAELKQAIDHCAVWLRKAQSDERRTEADIAHDGGNAEHPHWGTLHNAWRVAGEHVDYWGRYQRALDAEIAKRQRKHGAGRGGRKTDMFKDTRRATMAAAIREGVIGIRNQIAYFDTKGVYTPSSWWRSKGPKTWKDAYSRPDYKQRVAREFDSLRPNRQSAKSV